MKKLFLLLVIAAISASASAQLILNETFNYNSTQLCNVAGDPNAANGTYDAVGTWYNTGKSSDSNSATDLMTLVAEPLFYPGFINSAAGKTVKITNGGSGTNTRADVMAYIPYTDKYSTSKASKTVYYAFMMQINDCHSWDATNSADASDWRDVFCISEGSAGAGNSYRGRFWVKVNAEDPNKFDYTICKNTSFSVTGTDATNKGTLNNGQTYLVVIKQDFLEAATTSTGTAYTGTVKVLINPVIEATEPTTGWLTGNPDDVNTFGGTYGVALRSRNLGNAADIQIAGLRIAQSWTSVLGLSTGLNNVSYNNGSIRSVEKAIITEKAGKVDIFNLAGARVFSAQTNGNIETSLNKGLYMVRFVSVDGNASSAKVEIR